MQCLALCFILFGLKCLNNSHRLDVQLCEIPLQLSKMVGEALESDLILDHKYATIF